MSTSASLADLAPAVLVHLFLAGGALVVGPFALWLRKGSRGHRGVGYAWVTLMAGAALSSAFIRDFRLPNLFGYTPIHLLTIVTLFGLAIGVWYIAHRRIGDHRRAMQITYTAAVIAGVFALLPSRYLGGLLWHHTLGWI